MPQKWVTSETTSQPEARAFLLLCYSSLGERAVEVEGGGEQEEDSREAWVCNSLVQRALDQDRVTFPT